MMAISKFQLKTERQQQLKVKKFQSWESSGKGEGG